MAAQDLNAMAFPKLTEEQMTQLARYAGASTKTFRAGDALFRAGDRDAMFFVINLVNSKSSTSPEISRRRSGYKAPENLPATWAI